MKGMTYFDRNGFSINEGAGPANIHMSWTWQSFTFYIYVGGLRFSFIISYGSARP
jgi:hypothetical protein